mmetsp:Transcript_33234/g.42844  ORF Transcript_33234/g.42844 Transcript_33234/m.42844 type:complete len:142 (-) Transcript_33234:2517-2942(-)
MEVNFSQFGQNIAASDVVSTETANKSELQSVVVDQNEPQQQAKDDQGKQNSADNNDKTSKKSLNIESAVSEISDFLQSTNRQLSFSVDEKSDRQIVKVTDSESGEIIRQIPSEDVLALSERIRELQSDVGSAVGVLLNKQV